MTQDPVAAEREAMLTEDKRAKAKEWETTSSAPIPFAQTIAAPRSSVALRQWPGPSLSTR